MDIPYQYEKKRKEFGCHVVLEDSQCQILESIQSSHDDDANFIVRQPSITTLDTNPVMAEHAVNTERVRHAEQGMKHVEGGWPENVDFTEQEQVERYLKKANKDTNLKSSIQALGAVVDMCVRQNNTVDIYEDYFEGEEADHTNEAPSAKGLAVFRDPNSTKRSATCINWHPDGDRIAVAYSILHFQDERMSTGRLPLRSYIWDVSNPNAPASSLVPHSPLVSLRYNHKFHDLLLGGSYNGLLSVFDVRASASPVCTAEHVTEIERSHHDPVYDAYWINSKTNRTFVSTSTDGQLLFWDMRDMSKPTDSVQLVDTSNRLLGGSALEYSSEAQGRYLIGTEQGIVLQLTARKGNKKMEVKDTGAGKHHGPIYDIQRNPIHAKFFMTVGDWTAKVWSEDTQSPIMTTKYCRSYLTAGCWSPTRAGVFFTTRMDGVVDVWDYYHKQNAVAYSHKVSDFPLSSIAVQGHQQQAGSGKLAAVGDSNGTVALLELSDNLARPQSSEKTGINAMFERETAREKNLEKRANDLAQQARLAEKQAAAKAAQEAKDDGMEDVLRKVDAEFLAMIRGAEEEAGGAAAGGGGAGR